MAETIRSQNHDSSAQSDDLGLHEEQRQHPKVAANNNLASTQLNAPGTLDECIAALQTKGGEFQGSDNPEVNHLGNLLGQLHNDEPEIVRHMLGRIITACTNLIDNPSGFGVKEVLALAQAALARVPASS